VWHAVVTLSSDKTTIQVTEQVRDQLDARKEGDESYNTVLLRLLEDGGQLWTEDELRALIRQEFEEQARVMNGR
jgi:predicted CopG family antitoxin